MKKHDGRLYIVQVECEKWTPGTFTVPNDVHFSPCLEVHCDVAEL